MWYLYRNCLFSDIWRRNYVLLLFRNGAIIIFVGTSQNTAELRTYELRQINYGSLTFSCITGNKFSELLDGYRSINVFKIFQWASIYLPLSQHIHFWKNFIHVIFVIDRLVACETRYFESQSFSMMHPLRLDTKRLTLTYTFLNIDRLECLSLREEYDEDLLLPFFI